jgi:hypothetical protein
VTTRRPWQEDPWQLLEPQRPHSKRPQEARQRREKVDMVSLGLKFLALALIVFITVLVLWFSYRLHHLQPIAVYNEPTLHSR